MLGIRPFGTTNWISVELTENSPQAASPIETETPFSSTGKAGERVEYDAFALVTLALEGARLTLDCRTASSPGATPIGRYGVGLADGFGLAVGLGDGLGDGLGEGLAVGVGVGLVTGTGIRLAPVNIERVPVDSAVIWGDR